MKWETDVRGAEATLQRIKSGIKDAMEETVEDLLDAAEDDGQDVLRDTNTIWRRETYHGFEKTSRTYRRTASGRIANLAPHATVVERGAEYGSEGPPVQALMPWVAAHWGTGSYDAGGSSGGGGTSPSGSDYDSDSDGDFDDDGWPDHELYTGDDVSVLSKYVADPKSWNVYDHPDTTFRPDDVWVGQDVVIRKELSHPDQGLYKGGTIIDVESDEKIRVELDDGHEVGVFYGSKYSVIASKAFEDLSDSEKRSAVQATLDNIPRDSDFNQTPLDYIDRAFDRYREKIKNPRQMLRMAVMTEEVKTVNNSSGTGPHIPGDRDRKGLYIAVFNFSGSPSRKDGLDEFSTHLHETKHAILAANGHDYPTNIARNSNLNWDTVDKWENASGNLSGYDWYAQGGPGNFHVDHNNTSELPDPRVYMLLPDDVREDATATKPADYDTPKYDAYSWWADYVYKESISHGEVESIDYGGTDLEQDILHPDHGIIEAGDMLKVDVYGQKFNIEYRALSGIREYPEGKFDTGSTPDDDGRTLYYGLMVEDKDQGIVEWLRVTDDGKLGEPGLTYEDFAPEENVYGNPLGDDTVPDDPGFYHNDGMELYAEGVNRAMFRAGLVSEVKSDYGDWIPNRDYFGVNGQEAAANWMQVFFSDPADPDYQGRLHDIQKVYENNPDLLWSTLQTYGAPEPVKTELMQHTGKTWQEILDAIEP